MMTSRLFNIEPIGIGTPFVESLPGYIKRLAEAHLVKPGTLLDKHIYPQFKEPHYCKLSSLSYEQNMGCDDPFFNEVIQILEMETANQNVHYTHIKAYLADIYENNFRLRKHAAWCPICFQESKESHKPIYEQLIWCFERVKVCGKHQLNLSDVCPHCDKQIKRFHPSDRVGYCYNCHAWLGSNNFHDMRLVKEQDIDNYKKIADRLSDLSTVRESPTKLTSSTLLYDSDTINYILSTRK